MLTIKFDFQLVIIGSVIMPSTEEFLQTIFDEQGGSKNAHDPENRLLEFEVVLNNGNEAIWMVSMRETPSLCFVWMSHDYSSELPLWQKTHNLIEHVLSNMHIFTYFDSVANMQISNHGKCISTLNNCA